MNRISRRNFLKAAGVGAAALGLAACGGSSSSTAAASGSTAAAASGDTIKVGVMGPLSGNVSVYRSAGSYPVSSSQCALSFAAATASASQRLLYTLSA